MLYEETVQEIHLIGRSRLYIFSTFQSLLRNFIFKLLRITYSWSIQSPTQHSTNCIEITGLLYLFHFPLLKFHYFCQF